MAPVSVARRRQNTLAAALGLGLCVLLSLFSTAAPAAADSADADTSTPEPRVLFIGMTGVVWDDVSAQTPALQRLADEGSIGSNVARSLRASACPADGWLAVSTGSRAADADSDECRELSVDTSGSTTTVDGWDDFLAAAKSGGYAATPGTFGEAINKEPLLAAGFGPGAAIMLADSSGHPVGDYSQLPGDMSALAASSDTAGQQELTAQLTQALTTQDLVVLDAGSIRDDESGGADDGAGTGPRSAQVAAVDARLSAALQALDDVHAAEEAAGEDWRPTTVLGVSLADGGSVPRLQVGFAAQMGEGTRGFDTTLLTSSGTRQPGYVQTHDFTATVVNRLGLTNAVPSQAFVGSQLAESGSTQTSAERIDALRDDADKSATVRQFVPRFYTIFIAGNLMLFAGISFGLTRMGRRRLSNDDDAVGHNAAQPRTTSVRVLTGLRIVALMMAAVPVATYLVNLTPWWRAALPGLAVTGLILAWCALITAVSLLGPWRKWLLGSVGVVAGFTMLVLAADVMTGARLQLTSLMGTQPLVAGRFYGFNNTAFALLITSSILVAFALTNPLIRRGKRVWAAVIIAGIGIFTTAIDGLPSIGADFGGPPAFIPGFALFTLLAAGIRITWRWAVRVIGLTLVLVTGVLVLDWLRPVDERTHLGNFFQTVLDGGMWTVIGRKLDQNLQNIFGSWFTLLAAAGLLLVVFALGRPIRAAAKDPEGGSLGWLSGRTDLRKIGSQLPLFRAAMITLALTHAIGFAVNDSGIVIPAIGMAAAIPLLIDLFSNWMRLRQDDAAAAEVAPVSSQSGSSQSG